MQVLSLGGRVEQSSVVRKDLNPEWKADFVFAFESVEMALAETVMTHIRLHQKHEDVAPKPHPSTHIPSVAQHRPASLTLTSHPQPPTRTQIGIEAWDRDEVSDNDKLGAGSLQLAQHRSALESGERVECSVPLEHKPMIGKAVAAGQVFVTIAWEKRAQ